jgi:hypothetical protein
VGHALGSGLEVPIVGEGVVLGMPGAVVAFGKAWRLGGGGRGLRGCCVWW